MSWILSASAINWVDLLNYPHFGSPQPGQFAGPPLVFVLLDFAVFLYLCRRFIWKALVGMAQEENRKFQDEVAEAVAKETEADRIEANVQELEATFEARKQEIIAQMQQEIGIEREAILEKAQGYLAMRRNETLKQIVIKQDMMVRQIRDEVLIESLLHLKQEIPGKIDPEASPYLFQKGLDSTFGTTQRHES
jgi:F-type H+-transporting ATPase subunit b